MDVEVSLELARTQQKDAASAQERVVNESHNLNASLQVLLLSGWGREKGGLIIRSILMTRGRVDEHVWASFS